MVLGVPQSNPLRLAQLKRAFKDVECSDAGTANPQGSNLLCTLPGKSTDTVLIAAHYRQVGEGMSAVDDWSGSLCFRFFIVRSPPHLVSTRISSPHSRETTLQKSSSLP